MIVEDVRYDGPCPCGSGKTNAECHGPKNRPVDNPSFEESDGVMREAMPLIFAAHREARPNTEAA